MSVCLHSSICRGWGYMSFCFAFLEHFGVCGFRSRSTDKPKRVVPNQWCM